MKFEQFAKNTIPYGCTIDMGKKGKWLRYGNVYMKIPEYVGSIGNVVSHDGILELVLNVMEVTETADLIDAYLPEPDSKASEIVRVFENLKETMRVEMSNKTFGIIEKKDMCFIDSTIAAFDKKDKRVTALLVGKPVHDIDKFEIDGIILNIKDMEE